MPSNVHDTPNYSPEVATYLSERLAALARGAGIAANRNADEPDVALAMRQEQELLEGLAEHLPTSTKLLGHVQMYNIRASQCTGSPLRPFYMNLANEVRALYDIAQAAEVPAPLTPAEMMYRTLGQVFEYRHEVPANLPGLLANIHNSSQAYEQAKAEGNPAAELARLQGALRSYIASTRASAARYRKQYVENLLGMAHYMGTTAKHVGQNVEGESLAGQDWAQQGIHANSLRERAIEAADLATRLEVLLAFANNPAAEPSAGK